MRKNGRGFRTCGTLVASEEMARSAARTLVPAGDRGCAHGLANDKDYYFGLTIQEDAYGSPP